MPLQSACVHAYAHVCPSQRACTLTVSWRRVLQDTLRAAQQRLGIERLSVSAFARFEAGEGIERESKDFAADVAAAAGVK